MKLHAPFIISAHLAPALKIGDATLSLIACLPGRERRAAARLILNFADGTEYDDESMQSGQGGFGSIVAIFESYLGFMSAAAEAIGYQRRTGQESENADLFPPEVMSWIDDHASDIESALCELQDENGHIREELIEEE